MSADGVKASVFRGEKTGDTRSFSALRLHALKRKPLLSTSVERHVVPKDGALYHCGKIDGL